MRDDGIALKKDKMHFNALRSMRLSIRERERVPSPRDFIIIL